VCPISLGRRASGNFILFTLWSKWNIVTTWSSLKEYYFGGNLDSWLLKALFLAFDCISSDNSTDIVSFPLAWEDCAMSLRPLLFVPYLPLGVDGPNFLADFSAISACSTNSFQIWALTAPMQTSTWSKKLCLHVCKSMGNGILAEHIKDKFLNRSI